MDEDKAAKAYSYIYMHPSERGMYGMHGRRDPFFVKFIKENTTGKQRILDAGCGRGHLLRWLIGLGHYVTGTEIADSLLAPGGDLFGLPVLNVRYSELGSFDDDAFNIVISNDVLEHLPDENHVLLALEHMARIASDYVLVSTGGVKAAQNPCAAELGFSNLHTIIRDKTWWANIYTQFCDVDDYQEVAGSIFFFGSPK